MKKILLLAGLLLLTISCERQRNSSIVGVWDYAATTIDGGATWVKVGDWTYDFKKNGDLVLEMENIGLTNEYHYNVCSRRNLMKVKPKDLTSYSAVNQNCDCADTNTFRWWYNVNTDTLEISGNCLSRGDTIIKYYRR